MRQSLASVSRLAPIMRRLVVCDIDSWTRPSARRKARGGRSGMLSALHASFKAPAESLWSNTICSGPRAWTSSPNVYDLPRRGSGEKTAGTTPASPPS